MDFHPHIQSYLQSYSAFQTTYYLRLSSLFSFRQRYVRFGVLLSPQSASADITLIYSLTFNNGHWYHIMFQRQRYLSLVSVSAVHLSGFSYKMFLCLGDYLHLTRQHWISSLSLILPGNDDDSHLRPATRQTTFAMLEAACPWRGPWDGSGAWAAEMALRIHLTLQCWIVRLLF